MSSYRYVIFPRGRQPSVDEVNRLQQFAGALANKFAYGVCRDEPRLAIAFDARAFDHVKASDAGFEALIDAWQAHGAELADRLRFIKDASALKPVRTAPASAPAARAVADQLAAQGTTPAAPRSDDARLAAKRLFAREAVAHSWLGVSRTLERYAAVQRFAEWFPYLLILMAIAATAGAGFYLSGKLTSASYQPRQQTIEQTINEPVDGAPTQ
jgi:hypothetical protein